MSDATAAAHGPESRTVSRRGEFGTYAAGMLTDSQSELISFVIPLYALALGLGPLQLGILVSAKAVLPSVLAIHGGVLMDRYGTRLVMSLMAAASALIPPLFPIATWFPALLLLQMAIGVVTSFSWMGAQTLAVTVGRDNPKVVGRFAFFARIGVMCAPVAAGAMWDFLPHWVAFMAIAVVGAAFWIAVRSIPPADLGEDKPEDAPRQPFRIGDIMPRLGDYIGAIGLLAIPAVAFVVVVSSVRITSALLQHSFYIIYLREVGLQATFIGLFATLSQAMAALGALSAARFTRFIHPQWVFLGAVTTSMLCIYSTPIFGSAFVLLAAAIALRGFAQGTSQPLMYTILSRAAGPDARATSIGLRSTGNRFSTLVVPVFMGAVAQFWGLHATFFVTGAILLAILATAGFWLRHTPLRADANTDSQ